MTRERDDVTGGAVVGGATDGSDALADGRYWDHREARVERWPVRRPGSTSASDDGSTRGG